MVSSFPLPLKGEVDDTKPGADEEAQFPDGDGKNKNPAFYNQQKRKGGPLFFLRRGWFWSALLAVAAASVVAPLAVRYQRGLKQVPLPVVRTSSAAARPWAGAVSAVPDPPSCDDLSGDLLNGTLSGGTLPPRIKVDGARLASADGGGDLALRGVVWPGFDAGATFVELPGLDTAGRGNATVWEAADFGSAVGALRLLGFNAVVLPFSFDALLAAPGNVARACPGERPNATAAAARTAVPGREPQGGLPQAPSLDAPARPEGDDGATCNAGVPDGPSALARLLWTAEYAARAGLYVVLRYSPPPTPRRGGAAPGPLELDSPAAFAAAWQRLGAALACSPAWRGALAGRLGLGLLDAPAVHGLGWRGGGGGEKPPLGEYYLAAADALWRLLSDGGADYDSTPLLLLAGGGAGGDDFAAGPERAAAAGSEDAAAFFGALADRSYAGRVVLAPRLAPAVSTGAAAASGLQQWDARWGGLQSEGFCSNATGTSVCRQYPAVAGIGARLDDGGEAARLDAVAPLLAGKGPAEGGATAARVIGWFWEPFVDYGSASGRALLRGDPASPFQWAALAWLQDKAGLRPWYWQPQRAPGSSTDTNSTDAGASSGGSGAGSSSGSSSDDGGSSSSSSSANGGGGDGSSNTSGSSGSNTASGDGSSTSGSTSGSRHRRQLLRGLAY